MPEPDAVAPLSPTQIAAWESGAVPGVEHIDEVTWSIPVAMPTHAMRYTLCYARAGADGDVVLIDPGWDADASWSSLRSGMVTAGIPWERVAGVVVTHHHGDHLGLAGRVREASGGWVAMAAAPRRFGLDAGLDAAQHAEETMLRGWGIPDEALADVRTPRTRLEAIAALPRWDIALNDGDQVPLSGSGLTVLSTPGHASDHIVLVDDARRRLFSGDHLLPRLYPHVTLEPGGIIDPIGSYLRGLDVVRGLPVEEVLPGHEWRFAGLRTRVDETRRYHQTHLRAVEIAVQNGAQTAWDVARSLPRRRSWEDVTGYALRLAIAHAAACMNHLRRTQTADSAEGEQT